MKDSDGKILKALLITLISYSGAIIIGILILFGGLYLLSCAVECLAPKIPFWVLWTLFLIICFGLFFGSLASSPGAYQNKKK